MRKGADLLQTEIVHVSQPLNLYSLQRQTGSPHPSCVPTSHESPLYQHVFHSSSSLGQPPSNSVCWFGFPSRLLTRESITSAVQSPRPPHTPSLIQTLDIGGRSQAQGFFCTCCGLTFLGASSSADHWAVGKDRQLAWNPSE